MAPLTVACRSWPLALLALLCLCGCAGPAAPAKSGPPQAAAGTGCSLRVEISSTGTAAWGTVVVETGGRSYTLESPSQTLKVICADSVALSQTPADSIDAPFRGWRLGGHLVTSTRTSLLVNGKETVTAVYEPTQAGASPPAPSPDKS